MKSEVEITIDSVGENHIMPAYLSLCSVQGGFTNPVKLLNKSILAAIVARIETKIQITLLLNMYLSQLRAWRPLRLFLTISGDGRGVRLPRVVSGNHPPTMHDLGSLLNRFLQ